MFSLSPFSLRWLDFLCRVKIRGETGEALPVEEEQVGSDLFLLGWHLGNVFFDLVDRSVKKNMTHIIHVWYIYIYLHLP